VLAKQEETKQIAGKGVIWVVLNSEGTQGKANSKNAKGCKAVCDARIAAQADMLYGSLYKQAKQLRQGDRIVMHQGGGKQFGMGAAHLVAAGVVEEQVQPLTPQIAHTYSTLWNVTKQWYTRWPATPAGITNELFMRYKLKRAKHPLPRPAVIRPQRGSKCIPLHPECSAYAQVDVWWQQVMADP
jgi:hypothetical protein